MSGVEERGALLRWIRGGEPVAWGTDPGAFEPALAQRALHRLRVVFGPHRWFRVSVTGWENLPDAPVMLVGNHSGGTSIPDVWGFLYAWYRHFGTERVVHPLAHEMVFSVGRIGELFSRLGVLRATPERAREVLEVWSRDLFVLPGGDRDTWRPWRERFRVHFAGRTGYARTALQLGVPVVPVAHVGAHGTLVVIASGRRIAKGMRLKRIARASVWPVHLSLPWGLAVGPVPHIPTPAHLRYRIGAPVPLPEGVVPGEPPSDEAVRAYDEAIRVALQALLDDLAAEARSEPGHLVQIGRDVLRRRRRKVTRPATTR